MNELVAFLIVFNKDLLCGNNGVDVFLAVKDILVNVVDGSALAKVDVDLLCFGGALYYEVVYRDVLGHIALVSKEVIVMEGFRNIEVLALVQALEGDVFYYYVSGEGASVVVTKKEQAIFFHINGTVYKLKLTTADYRKHTYLTVSDGRIVSTAVSIKAGELTVVVSKVLAVVRAHDTPVVEAAGVFSKGDKSLWCSVLGRMEEVRLGYVVDKNVAGILKAYIVRALGSYHAVLIQS